MAYTINRTSGAILATVADGTIDTSTDVTLVGKNYAGYGEILNENFVKLLENFSNTTAPANPISGQIWWDSSGNLLKVYTGTAFKTVSSSTASATAPTGNVTGDLWWDTTNNQLNVYNGSSFTLIGPAFTAGSGQSGAIVDTVADNVGTDHVVVKMFVSDTIVAIISKDAVFTPQVAISGFATIKQGYNLNSTLASGLYNGTATNAEQLGGVTASSYLRSDANDATTGTLAVSNDTGFTVGADADAKISVSTNNVIIDNQTQDGDILIRVNDGGSVTTAIAIDGATSLATVASNPTANLGIATKQYVDSQVSSSGSLLVTGGTMTGDILSSDSTQDIGTSGTPFQAVYATTFSGTATQAQYADLAERFASDDAYEVGTVVALGGTAEITAVTQDAGEDVFGVVSGRAAYLMNAGAGDDASHPAVAMTGRVPVKVIGECRKGDRLISAGNGMARVGTKQELTAYNTIGRALADKYEHTAGLVEAIVSIK